MLRRTQSRPAVTDTDRSPIIELITWLLLATIFLALSFRLLTRFFLTRQFRYDDLLIVISFVFGLGQSVTLLVPGSKIWGNSLQDFPPDGLASALKAQYAGDLLFILSLCFAKFSVPMGLLSISPVKSHRHAVFMLGSIVTAWAVSSEFALAFQCQLPAPWDYIAKSCLDRQSLLLYIGILNIITDMGLIVLPIYIIAPLRMPLKKRLSIIALFSARITVVVAIVVQLSYLHLAFTPDITFSIFPFIICNQLVQALSIITASIPYLQPFLESLKSGQLWMTDVQRLGATTDRGSAHNDNSTRRNYVEIEAQDAVRGGQMEMKTLKDKAETQ